MQKERVIILPNTQLDFTCDYVLQMYKALSQKADVAIFYPTQFSTWKRYPEKYHHDRTSSGLNIFPSFGYIPFQRFSLIRRANIFFNVMTFYIFYILRYGLTPPIFWVFGWNSTESIPYLFWKKLIIYDRVDHAGSLDPDIDQVLKIKDEQLLKTADYIFVNSHYAFSYVKKRTKKVHLAPWGFNPDLLPKRLHVPRKLQAINHPKIGFIGNIDHRTNFLLLEKLAKRNPKWNIVLVGPILPFDIKQELLTNTTGMIKKLQAVNNIYFLGKQPKQNIFDCIANFDVCIIPYDTNQEFVKGCNPMKLYEYLGVGRPVVSSPISAVMRYAPIAKNASSLPAFEKHIANFLALGYNSDDQKQGKNIAIANSWSNRVNFIWNSIKPKLNHV